MNRLERCRSIYDLCWPDNPFFFELLLFCLKNIKIQKADFETWEYVFLTSPSGDSAADGPQTTPWEILRLYSPELYRQSFCELVIILDYKGPR